MSDAHARDDGSMVLREVAEAGRRARGNPEKWSDIGRQMRFLDAMREGFSIGKACEQAGWTYQAWRRWAAEAEAADERGERCQYSDLHDAYIEAKREGDGELYRTIRSSAKNGDTKAAMWILERRESATWAKSTAVELTGKDGGPVQVVTVDDLAGADEATLRAIAASRAPA